MITTTKSGATVDMGKGLSAPERHVLQQLLLWMDLMASVEEFRTKKEQAVFTGWNNSGPIRESQVLSGIVRDLEGNVVQRLLAEKMGH